MTRFFILVLVIWSARTVFSLIQHRSASTRSRPLVQSATTDIEFSSVESFPCSVSVVPGCDSWPQRAANYLKKNGVCVLLTSTSDVDDTVHENVNKAANSRLAELKRRIENRGVDPNGKEDGPFRFLEVTCRDDGGRRYDLPVSWKNQKDMGIPLTHMESQAVSKFHHHIEAMVHPVLDILWKNGDDCDSSFYNTAASGFLINKPGSLHQNWHRDGPKEGMMNVFCPLVDLKAELGPTEIWPSTHTSCPASNDPSRKISPLLKRGQLLLMDYRTFHRGLGNKSQDTTRTVAYVVFQKGNESVGDIHNFPDALTLEYD